MFSVNKMNSFCFEGEPFTQEEMDEMLSAAVDPDKNVILYKDFVSMMTFDDIRWWLKKRIDQKIESLENYSQGIISKILPVTIINNTLHFILSLSLWNTSLMLFIMPKYSFLIK